MWVGPVMAERAPSVVAHRGASIDAPGNSLAAFRKARAAGADGVELDVRLTKDGHVVVFHDAKAVLPDGRKVKVSKLSLAELRTIDLGGGQRVPTLSQVMRAVGPRMKVNIELKAESIRNQGLEGKVAEIIKRRGAANKVYISSFNPWSLRRIKRIAPELKTGSLVAGKYSWRLATRLAKPEAIHPSVKLLDKKRVDAWHKRGLKVRSWTINDAPTMRKAARLGIDAIITDDPALARRTLGKPTVVRKSRTSAVSSAKRRKVRAARARVKVRR